MSVRAIQECTDSDEFAEWLAFQSIDPASEERADLRAGIIASVIANMMPNKGNRVLSPVDFMPFVVRPKPTQEQLEAKIMSWARAHNAGMKRRRDRG